MAKGGSKQPNMAQLRALNQTLTDEVERLRKDLEEARAETARAVNVAEKLRRAAQPVTTVPEPKGPGIKQYLRPAHAAHYSRYMASGRHTALWAHLVPTTPWKQQDVSAVHAYFTKLKSLHPELGKYANNWVSRRIAIQYFQNRRRAIAHQNQVAQGAEDESDDDSDDEADEQGEDNV